MILRSPWQSCFASPTANMGPATGHSHGTGRQLLEERAGPDFPQLMSLRWGWLHLTTSPSKQTASLVSLTLSACRIQRSPMFQQKGKQVISGPDERGKNETVVKVTEKLRSGPLIQGSPMLYRILSKSKEKTKETHYQHNSCQNVKITLWKSWGGGQGILLDTVR